MGRTLVIGDSLQVGTGKHLRKLVRGVEVDARSGRGSREGARVLKRKLAKRRYSKIVFDLGTNDMSAGELKRSLRAAKRAAGGTPLYVASVRGRDAARKNRVLRRSGVKVVPWAEKAEGGGDGIHSSPVGYRKRARLIARNLEGTKRRRYTSPSQPSYVPRALPVSSEQFTYGAHELAELKRRLKL